MPKTAALTCFCFTATSCIVRFHGVVLGRLTSATHQRARAFIPLAAAHRLLASATNCGVSWPCGCLLIVVYIYPVPHLSLTMFTSPVNARFLVLGLYLLHDLQFCREQRLWCLLLVPGFCSIAFSSRSALVSLSSLKTRGKKKLVIKLDEEKFIKRSERKRNCFNKHL